MKPYEMCHSVVTCICFNMHCRLVLIWVEFVLNRVNMISKEISLCEKQYRNRPSHPRLAGHARSDLARRGLQVILPVWSFNKCFFHSPSLGRDRVALPLGEGEGLGHPVQGGGRGRVNLSGGRNWSRWVGSHCGLTLPPPPWIESHTRVKALPSLVLRKWSVKNFHYKLMYGLVELCP